MFFDGYMGAPPTVTVFSWEKLGAEVRASDPVARRAAVKVRAAERRRVRRMKKSPWGMRRVEAPVRAGP
jgi:hypothetical protein